MTGKDIRMVVLLALSGTALAICTWIAPRLWILVGLWAILVAILVGDHRNRKQPK